MAAIQRATSLLEKNDLERTFFFKELQYAQAYISFSFFTIKSGFLSNFLYEVHKKNAIIFKSNG